MRLNTKEQLNAICSALLLGAGDYQNHAAAQNSRGNLDAEMAATARAIFLRALYDCVHGMEENPELNEPLATFSLTRDQLDDIAAVAGVRVREVMQYRPTDFGDAQKAIPPSTLPPVTT